MTDHTTNMLLGALVADAASLGTHWIYEPERITQIAQRHGTAAFAPIDPVNYDGVKGYFAHGSRHGGMQTQYGEVLRIAIQSINANDGFDVAAYQAAFAAHFGAGGSYQGYIDGPTKAALANIAADEFPSGSDDDQTPALARLPAIFARYQGQDNLSEMLTASLHVTHMNAVAQAYTDVFADVLGRVMHGEALGKALEAAAQTADPAIKAEISEALSTQEQSSTDFAGRGGMMGRACGLLAAGPVMFHILKRAESYADAIERNIRAGGDTAGRSIMIGAIMARVHGAGTDTGIPVRWMLQVHDAVALWDSCTQLSASTYSG